MWSFLSMLFPTPTLGSLAIACSHAPTDSVSRLEPDRVQLAHYPPYPHALRYGHSRQATVYLASRTYGICLTIRTGPREARSQRLHVAERSATEFIEILYASTTPLHSSHCSTPPTYMPTGRTCMPSVSEIAVEHLLLS